MKIALTTTLDDSYVLGFLITFSSIKRCNPNLSYDLVIFEWGELSEINKQKIKKIYNNVQFKSVNIERYNKCKFDESWRKWNYNCNYRFDIFTLNQYDKIIYFDCDIIFNIPLDELLKYDGNFCASIMKNYNGYIQVKHPEVFNAGLMVIGKKYLNENTIKDLIEISNTKPEKSMIDWVGNQPILNNYFFNDLTNIPEKFNFLMEDINFKSFEENKNYHFIGTLKPWDGDILQNQFSKHVLDSIFYNSKNLIFFRKTLKKIFEMIELEKKYIKDII